MYYSACKLDSVETFNSTTATITAKTTNTSGSDKSFKTRNHDYNIPTSSSLDTIPDLVSTDYDLDTTYANFDDFTSNDCSTTPPCPLLNDAEKWICEFCTFENDIY